MAILSASNPEIVSEAAEIAPYALAQEARTLSTRLSPGAAVKDSGVNLGITLAVMVGGSLVGLEPSVLGIATLSGLTAGDFVRAAKRGHRLSHITKYG